VSWSTEEDYSHIGAEFSFSQDFNQKNTTFSTGIGYSYDSVEGVTGNPAPRTSVFSGTEGLGEQIKQVADVLLGVTQVFSKRVIGQFNFSTTLSNGYMNDPYKVVSIVDALGRPIDHVYESRPDSRLSQSLYSEFRIKTAAGVLKPSYRFFTNDWGIRSNTFGLSYRIDIGKRSFFEPVVRFYSQTASDFYRLMLKPGEGLPAYVSSDYRLSAFNSITAGLHMGSRTGNDRVHWQFGVDYYQQIADDDAAGSINAGQVFVNPDLKAIVLRGSFRF